MFPEGPHRWREHPQHFVLLYHEGARTLPVQFGTAKHFCVNYVNFMVVDIDTTYHTILGRPALAKFMAIPHYTCFTLKMLME